MDSLVKRADFYGKGDGGMTAVQSASHIMITYSLCFNAMLPALPPIRFPLQNAIF